eukprot:CAMPEP_0176330612 /NCGR_PEP_ID=MMETSP0121_2-20121125/76117_1 /TAXON_ID=160619 /ORGANISM="Kryptoperidinium foliaceum, Strain CCMP 1326" /LENGTH=31 /DNA_ID= /DNA_START= /DNA_END= /DNA_ORIENTATION=
MKQALAFALLAVVAPVASSSKAAANPLGTVL